jgi:tetratricopeptide (TPR) repeat protein
MMHRYLEQQRRAQAAGLGSAGMAGEVVPHEAVPVHPVEPRLAWEEAVAVLACFQPELERRLSPPADWAGFVAAQEPALALPFCVGNYPQLVRDFLALLKASDLTTLRPAAARGPAVGALAEAVRESRDESFPSVLLTLGLLRLGRFWDEAAILVSKLEKQVPHAWQAAWANEQAALAWQRGQSEEALALWQAQAPSAPVLFNRGMAALFLGRAGEARAALQEAVALLPEDHGWHHLGRLYLALAEMHTKGKPA